MGLVFQGELWLRQRERMFWRFKEVTALPVKNMRMAAILFYMGLKPFKT